MGLIKAALGSLSSTLADQWREYYYCESMPANILVSKGSKRISGKSSNTKASDNVISNGAVVAVNEGQCMMIVEQGQIVEFAADIWRALPESLRQQAGDRSCYTWVVAVEALYLRAAGAEEKAVRAVKDSYLSPRRVSRVIRQLGRCVLQENIQPELENGDT